MYGFFQTCSTRNRNRICSPHEWFLSESIDFVSLGPQTGLGGTSTGALCSVAYPGWPKPGTTARALLLAAAAAGDTMHTRHTPGGLYCSTPWALSLARQGHRPSGLGGRERGRNGREHGDRYGRGTGRVVSASTATGGTSNPGGDLHPTQKKPKTLTVPGWMLHRSTPP